MEQFEKIWVIFGTKASDIAPVMAQSFRAGRSSFTSSNRYESPPLNSAVVSNGDDYDSDGSNFAPSTNFGRTASGLFIATSYDYDAPIDEYGLLREPKWGHLTNLHKAIKQCEPALVSSYPTVTWPGNNLEVHVFKTKSACDAFLANYDTNSPATVTFQNAQYYLPPWSVSILPDCKNAIFNTAKISASSYQPKMTPASGGFSWQSSTEQTVSADDSDTIAKAGLLEQISVTRDTSDYLWYLTNVNIQLGEGFLKNGQYPTLTIMSAGHALHVFINSQLSRTVFGSLENPKLTYSSTVKLRAGINRISLLSVAVGLPNVGAHYDTWNTGVLGPVTLKGLNEGTRDLTKQQWSYKVGLRGESLKLQTLDGSSSVEWAEGSLLATKQPLTWYKRSFPLTEEEYLLRLDDVASTLKCWGAVSHIRNSLAKLKERPRIGKVTKSEDVYNLESCCFSSDSVTRL